MMFDLNCMLWLCFMLTPSNPIPLKPRFRSQGNGVYIYLSKMPTATWFPWNMDKSLNRYPWPDTFEQRNDNCWKTSTPCNKPKKTNIQKLTLLNLKMDPETRRRNHLPNIPNLPFWGSTCWFSEMYCNIQGFLNLKLIYCRNAMK